MPRKEFSRKTKAFIIERAQGRCEGCQAALKIGEGDCDHILPADLGGDNKPANGQWLCKVCHKAKTKVDTRGIRKANRKRDKATGAIQPKGKIPARPKPGKKQPLIAKINLPPRNLYEGN